MLDPKHPGHHVNEEPRNDFIDVALGFAGMFAVMTLIFVVAVLLKQII
ncbi:YqzM family protein [Paenibacillus senegalensis]|nr:YqzM family protein [Paenibacillus senegalensis]